MVSTVQRSRGDAADVSGATVQSQITDSRLQ